MKARGWRWRENRATKSMSLSATTRCASARPRARIRVPLPTCSAFPFSKVQKHEKGSNRISASTLYEITRRLGIALDDLFQGAETIWEESAPVESRGQVYRVSELDEIPSAGVRRAVRGPIKVLSFLPPRRTRREPHATERTSFPCRKIARLA